MSLILTLNSNILKEMREKEHLDCPKIRFQGLIQTKRRLKTKSVLKTIWKIGIAKRNRK